jgi:1-deoxy-D-xylulose-5-phosphate reductoisomerase
MTERVSLLGSTGSIGTQVLDVVRRFPERFSVTGLAAGRNLARLAEQVREFRPSLVSIQREQDIAEFRALCPEFRGELLTGADGLNTLAEAPGIDTVIVALVGLSGLEPSLAALQQGRKLLTANKETFVAGGHLVQPYLAQVLPIDSEHAAIHQCLKNEPAQAVQKIYLTASGGPFRRHSLEEMQRVTLEEALRHPNWVMGEKITIDSATMMNKGLEIIEAHWLFGLPYDRIQVVVHPESIIHSGVEFVDGSILVQMGAPDMHGPIQYAMTYPERLPNEAPGVRMNLLDLSLLNLEPPDMERFPCIRLAYEAGRMGSSATAVLNGADEAVVRLFLDRRIEFTDIPRLLENVLEAHQREGLSAAPSLEEIRHLDTWAREFVALSVGSLSGAVL